MCREHVDDPHTSGRALGANDLVTDLSLALSHARFYGVDHRHVEDAIENALLSVKALLAEHGTQPVDIGPADGFIFHDQRPLFGADRAAERLVPVLEAVGAGGLSFGPATSERDLMAFVALGLRRDLPELDFETANQILEKDGATATRLLGVYEFTEGQSDYAARALGTKASDGSAGSSPHTGRPIFPAAIAETSLALSISAIARVTVVLPLVPVTATYGPVSCRAPNSSSLMTSMPSTRACRTGSECSGNPGETTASSTSFNNRSAHAPEWTT